MLRGLLPAALVSTARTRPGARDGRPSYSTLTDPGRSALDHVLSLFATADGLQAIAGVVCSEGTQAALMFRSRPVSSGSTLPRQHNKRTYKCWHVVALGVRGIVAELQFQAWDCLGLGHSRPGLP